MAGEAIIVQDIIDMTPEDSLAREIASRWTNWDATQTPHTNRIKEVTEYLFATSTQDTTNSQNPTDHKTNRPKITQIYDTLKALYRQGIIPKEKFFRFQGDDEESVNRAKRRNAEGYLITKHRHNKFGKVIGQLLDDWVREGNCYVGVEHVDERGVDEDGNPLPGYVGPRPFRIAPSDIRYNLLATDWKFTPKIIRSLTSIAELERDVLEKPDISEMAQRALDKVKQFRTNILSGINGSHTGTGQNSGPSVEDFNKYAQQQIDGFGSFVSYVESGLVEILTFVGDIYDVTNNQLILNHKIVVVDRRWLVSSEPVNTWSGEAHIYHSTWRDRLNNLYGMGPLENIVGLQFRLNHLENTRADQFDEFTFQDLVIRGDVEIELDDSGRTIYRVAESGDVSVLRPDTTVLNADIQIQGVELAMEQYAGVPREAAGFRTPGEKTKFEVQELGNAATKLFIDKMLKFEEEIVQPTLSGELEIGRRNLEDRVENIVNVDDETGLEIFQTITKQDLIVQGRVVPIGASHFAQQARTVQELVGFQNALIQDQDMALHFSSIKLAQMWEDNLGFENKKLMQPYVRVSERQQAARLQQTAVSQLEAEGTTSIGEDEDVIPEAEPGTPT